MNTTASLAQEWIRIDRDSTTKAEIEKLVEQNDDAELEKRLVGRIKFGTAGLRACMEAGFTRMNCVTVIQASQGLAAYVLEQDPSAAEKGIVIGHDARYHSETFARLAAAAFITKGIKVHWFDKLVHTPMVPFVVKSFNAAAGVMITASHNPPQDNGYKVYWSNGSQIIPPHDIGIANAIEKNLEPVEWILDEHGPLFVVINEEIEQHYYDQVLKTARISRDFSPFVYTPLHGVGLPFLKGCLHSVGARYGAEKALCVVSEQAEPDPSFRTVKFPNPEERGALDLAIQTATEHKYRLIIANDPDADRLAVAEYVEDTTSNRSSGYWHQFSGNELGILLASYALELNRSALQAGTLTMLCSTVSSSMLRSMAKIEGFEFVETLTGFKWLGNVAQDLIVQGRVVPYAFEEALGYMFTNVVSDKDGIVSALVFLAAVSRWREQSLTAHQKLQHLYQKYGYYAEANTYLISPSPEMTDRIFADIRASGASLVDGRENLLSYPKSVGSKKILYWRDLTVGFDSKTEDNIPNLPVDRSAQMITCELEGDVRFTARGSGTEPKIKLYVEGRGSAFQEAKSKAKESQKLIVREWFTPSKYGLIPA